jgi:hypothetical protein
MNLSTEDPGQNRYGVITRTEILPMVRIEPTPEPIVLNPQDRILRNICGRITPTWNFPSKATLKQ